MAIYILRTRPEDTLTEGGQTYGNGDRITLPKARAEQIAQRYPRYRFETVSGDDVISAETVTVSEPMPAAPKPRP